MRILSALFGGLLLLIGVLLLGFGLAGVVQAADSSTPQGGDWYCGNRSGLNTCQYTIGSVPEEQLDSTASLAITVAGGSLAVCGAIFMLIGTSRPQRAQLAAAPGPYGPPYAGRPGQQGPPAAPQPYPPQTDRLT